MWKNSLEPPQQAALCADQSHNAVCPTAPGAAAAGGPHCHRPGTDRGLPAAAAVADRSHGGGGFPIRGVCAAARGAALAASVGGPPEELNASCSHSARSL